MKYYSLIIFLHLLAVSGMLFLTIWFFAQDMRWSAFYVFLMTLLVFYNLHRIQTRTLKSIDRLFKSICTNDAMPNLTGNYKNQTTRDIANNLSKLFNRFHDQLSDGESKRIYYETLLNQVDTAVLICNSNQHVEWKNRATHTWLGDKFVPPADWFVPNGNESRAVTLTSDERKFEAVLSCSQLTTRQGKHYLITLKDIHSILERNEMEAWQKLIRVLTHEIMNSITPIASLSDTLCERSADEGFSPHMYELMLQAMQTIRRRSEGLLHFIEDYRKLTRIPTPTYTEIHVYDLVDDLKELYADKGVQIHVEPADLTFHADKGLIEQVLINLIKNACEACSDTPDPHVDVWFRSDEHHEAIINITDNGSGILPEIQEKIFVPFFTTKENGSGIGLSLCKQIMTLHKGTIRVRSELDKGSCFTLSFPPAEKITARVPV